MPRKRDGLPDTRDHDPQSLLNCQQLGSNAPRGYQYDANGNLLGDLAGTLSYGYDANGNLLSRSLNAARTSTKIGDFKQDSTVTHYKCPLLNCKAKLGGVPKADIRTN